MRTLLLLLITSMLIGCSVMNNNSLCREDKSNRTALFMQNVKYKMAVSAKAKANAKAINNTLSTINFAIFVLFQIFYRDETEHENI